MYFYLPGLITPAAEAQELSLEIIMSTSIDFNVKKITMRRRTCLLNVNKHFAVKYFTGWKMNKDITLWRKEGISYSLVVRTLEKYLWHLPSCNSTVLLKMSFFTGMFQGFRSQMQNNYFVEHLSMAVSVDVEIHW